MCSLKCRMLAVMMRDSAGVGEQEQGMEPVLGQPGRTSARRQRSPVSWRVVADPSGLVQTGEVAGFMPNPLGTSARGKGTYRMGV